MVTSRRASLQDLAKLSQHGYSVVHIGQPGDRAYGWNLLDHNDPVNPDGDALMIGGHGCLSPTQWEAVAEGLSRIDADIKAEALFRRSLAKRLGVGDRALAAR